MKRNSIHLTRIVMIDRELQIMPPDFAEEISKSAGFRNAIVHEYNNLDKGIVYKSVGEAVDQYKKYCEYILNFLDKRNT